MIALSLILAIGIFAGISDITPDANAFVCASYNSNCDGGPGYNVQCLPSARAIGKC